MASASVTTTSSTSPAPQRCVFLRRGIVSLGTSLPLLSPVVFMLQISNKDQTTGEVSDEIKVAAYATSTVLIGVASYYKYYFDAWRIGRTHVEQSSPNLSDNTSYWKLSVAALWVVGAVCAGGLTGWFAAESLHPVLGGVTALLFGSLSFLMMTTQDIPLFWHGARVTAKDGLAGLEAHAPWLYKQQRLEALYKFTREIYSPITCLVAAQATLTSFLQVSAGLGISGVPQLAMFSFGVLPLLAFGSPTLAAVISGYNLPQGASQVKSMFEARSRGSGGSQENDLDLALPAAARSIRSCLGPVGRFIHGFSGINDIVSSKWTMRLFFSAMTGNLVTSGIMGTANICSRALLGEEIAADNLWIRLPLHVVFFILAALVYSGRHEVIKANHRALADELASKVGVSRIGTSCCVCFCSRGSRKVEVEEAAAAAPAPAPKQ